MAALDFPSSPTNGQIYTANGITFTWNGQSWISSSSTETDNKLLLSSTWTYDSESSYLGNSTPGTFGTAFGQTIETNYSMSQLTQLFISPVDKNDDDSLFEVLDKALDFGTGLEVRITGTTNTAKYVVEEIQADGNFTHRNFAFYYVRNWGDDPSITRLFVFDFNGSVGVTELDTSAQNDFLVLSLSSVTSLGYFTLFNSSRVNSLSRYALRKFAVALVDNVFYDNDTLVTSVATQKSRFYSNYNTIIAPIAGNLYPDFYFFTNSNRETPILTGGSGTGAEISILLQIGSFTEPRIVSEGSGYTVNNVLTSETYPTLSITVTSVNGSGGITGVTVSGDATSYVQWPTNSISDGGADQYDTGNKIYTNLELTTALPYNDGAVTTDADHFGTGSSYVTVYKNAVFGMFIADMDGVNDFIINGNLGSDGKGDVEHKSLPSNNAWKLLISPLNSTDEVAVLGQDYTVSFYTYSINSLNNLVLNTNQYDNYNDHPKITSRGNKDLILSAGNNVIIQPRENVEIRGGAGVFGNKFGGSVSIYSGTGYSIGNAASLELGGEFSGLGGSLEIYAGQGGQFTTSLVTISSITQASPAVVTVSGFTLPDTSGDPVVVSMDWIPTGMTALSENIYYGAVLTSTTLELYYDLGLNHPVDTTGLPTFTSASAYISSTTGSISIASSISNPYYQPLRIKNIYWPFTRPNPGDTLTVDSNDGLRWTANIPGNAANVTGTVAIANGGTGATSAAVALTNLGAQAADPDLTAIAALTGTSGFLKKTAADTWSLDTASYTNNTGTVTSIVAGTGLTGGTITGSGTIAIDSTVATLTGTQTLTNKTLTSPTITGAVLNDGYTEEVFAVTGTTPALSPTNGSIQTWTLSGNSTPTAGTWNEGQSVTLSIDDGSAFTITWTSMPIVWKSNAGVAPTLNTTGVTIIILWKIGTIIYGARVGDA